MKSSGSTRARVAKILGIMAVAGLVAGALSSRAMSAQPRPAATRPTFESQEAWRAFMNGADYSALATSPSLISTASGSFASVTGVESESGYVDGKPPPRPNAYTLQLNSNFFTSAACSGAANPSDCSGWQHFVLSNRSCECAFMQYRLIQLQCNLPDDYE